MPPCPRCGALLPVPMPFLCGFCGHPLQAVATAPPARVLGRGAVWTALILNVVVPGVGTLYLGSAVGWLQLLLVAAGIATIPFMIGFPLLAAAWVWALLESIRRLTQTPFRKPA